MSTAGQPVGVRPVRVTCTFEYSNGETLTLIVPDESELFNVKLEQGELFFGVWRPESDSRVFEYAAPPDPPHMRVSLTMRHLADKPSGSFYRFVKERCDAQISGG